MESVFVIIALTAAAIDLLGAYAFWPGYFRMGIPIYRARLFYTGGHLPSNLEQNLTGRMRGHFLPSLVFRLLSDSEIGFRERFFEWGFRLSYTAVMHGVIVFSPLERSVVVTGRMNWYPIGFAALIVSNIWNSEAGIRLLFLGFLFVIFAVCYGVQLHLYRSATRVLSDRLRQAG